MIKLYNKYGEEIEMIDFIELQWNRKYKEPGNFSLHIAAKDYREDIKYIQLKDRPETGIVQKMVYEKTSNGDVVTLSGFFLEKLAEWVGWYTGIFWGHGSGNQSQSSIKQMVQDLLYSTFTQFEDVEYNPVEPNIKIESNLYLTKVAPDSRFPSSMDLYIPDGVSTGEALYSWLSATNHTYNCRPIFNPKGRAVEEKEPLLGLEFYFWKGRDLRENIYFGAPWGDVKKVNYTFDDSNVKSEYFIMQEIDETHSKIYKNVFHIPRKDGVKHYIAENLISDKNIPVNIGKVYPLKVLYTSIESEKRDEASLRNEMKRQATLDMLDNYIVEHISVDVIQNRFYYLRNYDLGDICTVVIEELRQVYTARIVEVNEVWSENKISIEVVLGTPQKGVYRKVLV